jgi:hypothetical protein
VILPERRGGGDTDLTARYEREFRERARAEFFADVAPYDGALFGSRRSWRDDL